MNEVLCETCKCSLTENCRFAGCVIIPGKPHYCKQYVPMTHYDLYRSLSIEALAELIFARTLNCEHCHLRRIGFCDSRKNCKQTIIDYLNSPVKEAE